MLTDHRRGRRSPPDQPGIVLAMPKPQTVIQKRLIDTAGGLLAEEQEVTFQYSILCQTSLPYRDPGSDVRRWSRQQGDALLEIDAGRAIHPELGRFVDVPLPHGPKARLILLHLNAEAVRTQSARVDVGDSLTAFVQRIGVDPKGRNIRLIREQVTALSTALIRLGFVDGRRAQQLHAQIVEGFELWLPKDARQRVLWPSYVDLNLRYFSSLLTYAVPLDERAIGALFPPTARDFTVARLTLARFLAIALEFQLGADILSPSWDGIGKLAAIAVIRTALMHEQNGNTRPRD